MDREPSLVGAMVFEYLRRLEPQPAPPAPTVPVGPRDEADLYALVARARAHAVDEEEEGSLACASPHLALPRFSGITLADVVLQPPPPHERSASLSITAPLPDQPRVLLGPGAMTMTLAVVATLVFGLLVATY